MKTYLIAVLASKTIHRFFGALLVFIIMFAFLSFANILAGSSQIHAQGICDRTDQVQTVILNRISGVTDCQDITAAHLASLTGTFDLWGKGISSLKSVDFQGLSSTTGIRLGMNQISQIPDGLFDGLTQLTYVNLCHNHFTQFPGDIFDNMPELTVVYIFDNRLTSIPEGLFDNNPKINDLWFHQYDTTLSSVPVNLLGAIEDIDQLYLVANNVDWQITSLDWYEDPDGNGLGLRLGHALPTDVTLALSAENASLSTSSLTITSGDTSVCCVKPSVNIGKSSSSISTQYTSLSYGNWGNAFFPATSTPYSQVIDICDRTLAVVNVLLQATSSQDVCSQVDPAELQAISGVLNMSNAGISSVLASDYLHLDGIAGIDFSGNSISHIDAAAFIELSHLTFLDLSGNSLSTLPEGFLSSFDEPASFSLNVDPGVSWQAAQLSWYALGSLGYGLTLDQVLPVDIQIELSGENLNLDVSTLTIQAGKKSSCCVIVETLNKALEATITTSNTTIASLQGWIGSQSYTLGAIVDNPTLVLDDGKSSFYLQVGQALDIVLPKAQSDIANDFITYTVEQLPDGVDFDEQTHTLSGAISKAGQYNLIYAASLQGTNQISQVQLTFIVTEYQQIARDYLARQALMQAQSTIDAVTSRLHSKAIGSSGKVQTSVWYHSEKTDSQSEQESFDWQGSGDIESLGFDVSGENWILGLLASTGESRAQFQAFSSAPQEDISLLSIDSQSFFAAWRQDDYQLWGIKSTGSSEFFMANELEERVFNSPVDANYEMTALGVDYFIADTTQWKLEYIPTVNYATEQSNASAAIEVDIEQWSLSLAHQFEGFSTGAIRWQPKFALGYQSASGWKYSSGSVVLDYLVEMQFAKLALDLGGSVSHHERYRGQTLSWKLSYGSKSDQGLQVNMQASPFIDVNEQPSGSMAQYATSTIFQSYLHQLPASFSIGYVWKKAHADWKISLEVMEQQNSRLDSRYLSNNLDVGFANDYSWAQVISLGVIKPKFSIELLADFNSKQAIATGQMKLW